MAVKPRVIFLELYEKRNSGFVKDGTQGTAFYEELNCPSIRWIPNSGFKAVVEKHGEEEVMVYKEIRWIKNCPIIDKEEQEKRNIKPNREEDKIPFEKGFATIAREGNTVSLFDYLSDVFYNADAANRSSTADKIYKVLELDKKAEEFDDGDIERAEAILLVSGLRTKIGTKEYRYNEDRMNAICEVCAVSAETAATKFHSLMSLAKAKPRWFLELIVKFEQTILTEVTQALELKVIRFEGNTVLYEEGDKVITPLGSGNMSRETKLEKLSDFLKTKEGALYLSEIRAKSEVAKEKITK